MKITDTPPQSDDTRFCRPESVLLDSFRLWSQSPENATYIRRRLVREMTDTATAVRSAKAIKLMSHIIGLHSRRTFYLRHPGSLDATADERALLALIGAQLHGRRPQAIAIARWLVPTPCHGTVLALAGELGRALRSGGLEIAAPREASAMKEDIKLRAVA